VGQAECSPTFRVLANLGVIAEAAGKREDAEIAAMLVGLDYDAIWLDAPVSSAACRLADYRPTAPPLSALVELIARDEFATGAALGLASLCLKEIAENVVLPETRSSAQVAIYEAVARRRDGEVVLVAIEKAVPRLFGVYVLRAEELLSGLSAWRAQKVNGERGLARG
jgi:hypothetical protein